MVTKDHAGNEIVDKEQLKVWEEQIISYINENKAQILADIMDIIRRGPQWKSTEAPVTRFPTFEREIVIAASISIRRLTLIQETFIINH